MNTIDMTHITIERAKLEQALDVLEHSRSLDPVDIDFVKGKRQATITAIKQALAAAVQEPYGYVWFTKHMEHRFTRMKPHPDMGAMNIKPIYTASPGQEPVAYTTGHCKEKAQSGGCQLHNLHCSYPACDRKAAPPAAQEEIQRLTALVRAQQITIDKLEAAFLQQETEDLYELAVKADNEGQP